MLGDVLPLASVGVLGVVAGVGFGSWLVVAAAAAVIVVGVVRWRRTDNMCPTPGADDNPCPLRQDAVLSPAHPYRREEESP